MYEMERIDSMSDASFLAHERVRPEQMPRTVQPEELANAFPEQAQFGTRGQSQQQPTKSKRLSKAGGAKLSKKNRWSLSRRPEVTV